MRPLLILLVLATPARASARDVPLTKRCNSLDSARTELDARCDAHAPVPCVRRVLLEHTCGHTAQAVGALVKHLPTLQTACNDGNLYACCATGVAYSANPSGEIVTAPRRLQMCNTIEHLEDVPTRTVVVPSGRAEVHDEPATAGPSSRGAVGRIQSRVEPK